MLIRPLIHWIYRGVMVWMLVLSCHIARSSPPVTLPFHVPPSGHNPFEREIWADVITPSGETVRLPAYYDGNDLYAVRARAEGPGQYRLGGAHEFDGPHRKLLPVTAGTHIETVHRPSTLPPIRTDATQPSLLTAGLGRQFVPIGLNLAWPPDGDIAFYKGAFHRLRKEGLNWARVWMAHWSHLNMEWLPEKAGPSPRPGMLDLSVARNWDHIVSWAEENGVYLQVVLQHHGQYSSQVNPNWAENPWNATQAEGFLAAPADFFSSAKAARLTRAKYRYIIARWGYSPAVMAWELFNEVHWVDALRLSRDEAAVARWHSEMAAYIRSIDRYGHLVTSSTDDTTSPIYTDLDYLQPHLYSPNILTAARRFTSTPANSNRPAFYGEIGDDHIPITPEEKATGIAIVPPVWASLMGEARLPAQPWQGAQLISTERLHELGAVSRFLAATKLLQRHDLTPFTPAVLSTRKVPLMVPGGQRWHKAPPQSIDIPVDGREPIDFADIPRILVGSPDSIAEGYAHRLEYRVVLPNATAIRIHLATTDKRPASMRVMVDGQTRAQSQLPVDLQRVPPIEPNPDDITIPLTRGAHSIVVENVGGDGWLDLAGVSFDIDVPVVSAAGQRGSDFITAWVWDRQSVLSTEVNRTTQGSLLLDNVPAGKWQVVWWDTLKGTPSSPTIIRHNGDRLNLTIPDFRRHTAVVLHRIGP